MRWRRNLRLAPGYQGMGKPPRKNMPARLYRCETVDYILHTFHLETKLQYLGLNEENAESLAQLYASQHIVLRFMVEKV